MRVLEPSRLGPEMEGLRWSSQRVVESCEPGSLVVVERVEERILPWPGRVFTSAGATALTAGTSILLADVSDRNDYNSRVELLGPTQSGSSDRRWRPSLIDCNDGGVPRWCWSRWAPHLEPLVRCCGGLGARATVLRRCL